MKINNVVVCWTEAAAETRENVPMRRHEFRGLLAKVRDEAANDGLNGGAYLKVAFLLDGESYRIDVTADPASIDLDRAWLY